MKTGPDPAPLRDRTDFQELIARVEALIKAERVAKGDPRPSLEELYGSHDAYVAKVAEAAKKLQAERLMLPEDVDMVVREAEASDVLR